MKVKKKESEEGGRVCECLEDMEIGDMVVFGEKASMFGSINAEGFLGVRREEGGTKVCG